MVTPQNDDHDNREQTPKLTPLTVYTSAISALGMVLLVWSVAGLLPAMPAILIFVALVILSELTTSQVIAPQMAFSMSSVVAFASILLLGARPAAVAGIAGGLTTTLVTAYSDWRRGRRSGASVLHRALVNMAANGLAVAVAGGGYQLLGGRTGEILLLSNLLPVLSAAVLAEFVNAVIVVSAISLQTGQPALQIWKQNVSWAVPINILSMVVGGSGLALGYQIAGLLGLVVFFLPIVLTIYAFNLYVRQTKAQMANLEELIADRTEGLRKANEELKRQDQAKTRFFSVINHEMRSPLTAIIGYTSLMLFEDTLSSDQQEMLDAVGKNSERILDLVNNILDVSRIEDGRLTVVQQPVDVHSTVEQALTAVKPTADGKHIAVHVDLQPGLPDLYVDPKRVTQILTNLLSNAIKYTPDTGAVRVEAERQDGAGMVQVRVCDNGIGIPADQLPNIFERFSRVERAETQHTVGTGLGLSIAKGLVEAHGGTIWVESEEGEGTTFSLTLPVSPLAAARQETQVV